MKKYIFTAILFLAAGFCFADTFTNKESGEILTGYAATIKTDDKTEIVTVEKGRIEVELSKWQIEYNSKGRQNQAVSIPVQGPIMLEIIMQATEDAILAASDRGPLFILIEIDTPGGRIDIAQKICLAIQKATCPVYAFVKRGEHSGAISAGAAIALACKKIYMAKGSVIGAATLIAMKNGKPVEIKDVAGKDIEEKLSSAWRGFLASLAEENKRPGLLTRAMVDREIEVVEVNDAGKRLFIEPFNKKQGQNVVHTWNKKGSLLTLTAQEAVLSGIADKLVTDRVEILADNNSTDANFVSDETIAKAQKEFDKVTAKVAKLESDIDFQAKRIGSASTASEALQILGQAKKDFENLKKLAKQYPDLGIDIDIMQERINTIEAASKSIKMHNRRR